MNKIYKIRNIRLKSYLIAIISLNIIFITLIFLEQLNINFSFLNVVISIYLIYIPGNLIIKVLRLYSKITIIENLLYSITLSFLFIMFAGLLINILYPNIGISDPLNMISLTITFSSLIFFFSGILYFREKNNQVFYKIYQPNIRFLIAPQFLFIIFLPVFSILGTMFMNYFNQNIILIFLIILISLLPIFTAYNKFPNIFLPILIFSISLSLLYHRSLISMYLWGWDIRLEYFYSSLVVDNLYWNFMIPERFNATLSSGMLAPILSILSKVDLKWLFKILFPIITSISIIGLYEIFKTQTNEKIAFFSCFLFVSIFIFYSSLLQLFRQQIATLFVISLSLILLNNNIARIKKSLLIISFGSSLIVSHYATAIIYLILIIAVNLLYFLVNMIVKRNYLSRLLILMSFLKRNYLSRLPILVSVINKKKFLNTSNFMLFFVVFLVAWYMYISSGNTLYNLVRIGEHFYQDIYSSFLDPNSSQALNLVLRTTPSIFQRLNKNLHNFTQFLIICGIIGILLNKRYNFNKEYLLFSVSSLLFLIFIIFVPYFALGTNRIYHLTLIFLAPFCILGFCFLIDLFKDFLYQKLSHTSTLKIIAFFLSVFIIFNSALIYEFTNDESTSISFNNQIDFPLTNIEEKNGMDWLLNFREINHEIFTDRNRRPILLENGLYGNIITSDTKKLSTNSYLFLGTWNLANDKVYTANFEAGIVKDDEYIPFNKFSEDKGLIYNNGGSKIYN